MSPIGPSATKPLADKIVVHLPLAANLVLGPWSPTADQESEMFNINLEFIIFSD